MGDSQNLATLGPDMDKFIPCYIKPELMCSVLYDGYPRDKRKIDITVCLQGGQVLELYQRVCVSSIKLPDVSNFREIQIMRNNKGERFYLILAGDEIIILLSTDRLTVHQRISGVEEVEICDPECSGIPKLMVKKASSTDYISFADIEETSHEAQRDMEYTIPVISLLSKKLIEAKYNLECNEKAYRQIEKLRQHASFLCHEDGALQLKTSKPIVRFCNKKLVIQLEVENSHNELIKKVCVLIHNNSCPAISYTSKVYEHISTIPFYKEIEFREIQSNTKASIVAVIPLSEFKSSIISKIDFSAIISYECQNKDYLQCFDDVQISAGDVMGENFDVFNSPGIDERSMCMAILSTTLKTKLRLKHKGLTDMISLTKTLCNYLKMDLLGENNKMAIHKHSPFHVLHGISIIFDANNEYNDVMQNEFNIDVYSRCPAQVLALIHFIYDSVSLSLVVTTPNIRATPYGVSNGGYKDSPLKYNYYLCLQSLLNQCSMTLEYLDECLKEMNKSKSMDGTDLQVDLFVKGYEEFLKYRNSMIVESENSFEQFLKSTSQKEMVIQEMDID